MKRFFAALVLLGFFLFRGASAAYAAERIASYDTRIAIRTDGAVDMQERIVYDFDDFERHGIFRTIPYVKTNAEGKRFAMDITAASVVDDQSRPYEFVQSTHGENVEFKIGDPDRTITGVHAYNLNYRVAGGLTYFSDHDELYWNIVGTQWQVPIDAAIATIVLPADVSREELRVACFTGPAGSTASDCTAQVRDTRTITVSADEPLGPGEGFTIVVGFPKGLAEVLEPSLLDAYTYTWWWPVLVVVAQTFLWLLAITWYGLVPLYVIYKWYRYGRDPKPAMGEVRAWYAAPTGRGGRPLTPGETGTLLDEHAGMHEVIATVIDLAHRGYISIEERKPKDFYIHKKSTVTHELEAHEQTLFDALFASGDVVRLKDADLIKPVEKMKTQLYEAVVHEGLFPDNPYWKRMRYYALALIALVTQNYPLALIAFFFGRAMPRKTPEGAQAAAIGRSLRNFITTQKKQFAFQAKHKMLFEKLLPFAIAFGVEEIWAKRFSRITVPSPRWYTGSSATSFRTATFVHSMNSTFVSSFAKAATPTSSSSGFSSGFSGGSSGGGGGGGGGGSW